MSKRKAAVPVDPFETPDFSVRVTTSHNGDIFVVETKGGTLHLLKPEAKKLLLALNAFKSAGSL